MLKGELASTLCSRPTTRKFSAQEEFLLALKLEKSLGSKPGEKEASGGGLLESARKRLLLWDITPRQVENLARIRDQES